MNLFNLKNIFYTVPVLLLFLACGKQTKTEVSKPKPNVPIDYALSKRIDSCMKRQRPIEKTAIYVYDLTADKPIYGFHENELMHTASCMKLLTGIAAQHLLGQQYNFDTMLFGKGKLDADHTFHGDVAFKAGLDPQFTPSDLRMFSRKLREKGFHKIDGKLWLDLVIDQPVTAEEHWYPWDLSFAKYGLFYKGSARVAREVKSSLRAQGITVADSNVVFGKRPKGSTCLFRYRRPLSLIVTRMWKNSSNTQSTGLLYAIGHRAHPHDNPVAGGVDYLKQFIKNEVGRNDSSFVIHDGCGLCTYNKLSPSLLVSVLRYGYQNKSIYNWLDRMLPLSGVDGTLHREMTHGPAKGKIRAKTGTLSHPYGISTLSGYCTGKNGHQLCFSIMNSEMSVLDARVMQRRLCEEFVQ